MSDDKVITVIAAGLLTAIAAYIVVFLWNAIIPDVFSGVSKITVWQALGMMVIVNIFRYDGSSK